MKEAEVRVIIDKMLRSSRWVLPNDKGKVNVEMEAKTPTGPADYLLRDSKGFAICIIEAKNSLKSPLDGKEQARRYAKSQNCRFAILSNGFTHYYWDINFGNPISIDNFPTQKELEYANGFNPDPKSFQSDEITVDYIAISQLPNYANDPDYINDKLKEEFIKKNKLRFLRDYQLESLLAVRTAAMNNQTRFLLEMATGTGKTLVASAIIKMFLRSSDVKRVLFLVDRIELERQANDEFKEILKNDFLTCIWKSNSSNWKNSEIVVSTIQTLKANNKYKRLFDPDDFDLVISDEAHRSISGGGRRVFEYFIGYKLGLTATPRDYLKGVDKSELSNNDPRELDKRMLLDTYSTFGCDSGQPTFRYSLLDGVKDGYLVNLDALDARTDITTELLSEKGYLFEDKDEDGNDIEEVFKKGSFETKFFSERTNLSFCECFMQNANLDPYSGEIGKSLIFCVSQTHAGKITNILNKLAHQRFPGRYQSDFAIQVTSSVDNAQQMTTNFSNNNLSGNSDFNPYYKTSKTRVCVTVGMMTTGYDCTDILNVVLMRPIMSPSDFVQMKGRGTRKHDFKYNWIDKKQIPQGINSEKKNFKLFDFFANCEFFEKEFDYNKKLTLPSPSEGHDGPTIDIDIAISRKVDPLISQINLRFGPDGMKVDQQYYDKFRNTINKDLNLKQYFEAGDFDGAEDYIFKNILDKPDEYFSLEKLRIALDLDRRLSVRELILHAFGQLKNFKTKSDLLNDEFEKFDNKYLPKDEDFKNVETLFKCYVLENEVREIIEKKQFGKLATHPNKLHNVMTKLPENFRKIIPEYIKDHVNLNRFMV